MDYLKVEQVKKEATTLKKALELSIKHHYQNTKLNPEDLEALNILPINILNGGFCGLCIFCQTCDKCPVNPGCDSKGSLWKKCKRALAEYLYISKTPENWEAFIEAEKKMHRYLCSLRKKI